jgi:excinuclease ABC subunit A
MEFDKKLIAPDTSLSFNEYALLPYNPESAWNHAMFEAIAEAGGFTLDTPLSKLTKKQADFFWNGDPDKAVKWIYRKQSGEGQSTYNRPWIGIIGDLKRRYAEAWGDNMRETLEKYMSHKECASCHGKRLRPEALGVTIGSKNIWQLTELSVSQTIDFFEKTQFTQTEEKIAAQVVKEIRNRLSFLKMLVLNILRLNGVRQHLVVVKPSVFVFLHR